MYKEYELIPKYERVKSYYGKARVIENDRYQILRSYATDVCVFDKKTGDLYLYDTPRYSRTTCRHIQEFLAQVGFVYRYPRTWANYRELLAYNATGIGKHLMSELFMVIPGMEFHPPIKAA